MQQLIRDHNRITDILYKYITDKTIHIKEMTRQRLERFAPTSSAIQPGDHIYTKMVNKRLPNDKLRFQKALVTDDPKINVLSIVINERSTTVPLKNLKRPKKVTILINKGIDLLK